jgi:hypothetical protein
MNDKKTIQTETSTDTDAPADKPAKKLPKEIGGREGPEPTRYGDWERKGIISDF